MPPSIDTKQPEIQTPVQEKKGLFHAHPLVSGASAIALLLLIGVFIVAGRTPLSGAGNVNGSWAGGNGLSIFSGGSRNVYPDDRVSTEDLLKAQVRQDGPNTEIRVDNTDQISSDGNYDWTSLLAQISGGGAGGQPDKKSSVTDLSDLYSYLPQGLISTTGNETTLTEAQQALFDYGNTVGSFIQGFDALHTNMTIVLTDAMNDRGDDTKAAAAAQIGADYVQLGGDLGSMDSVPASAQGMHTALANAYTDLGNNLMAQAHAGSDSELLKAMETYNGSADAWNKKFLALVNLFQVSHVNFSSTDPGSIFMFNSSPSF